MNIDDFRECVVFRIDPDDSNTQLAALNTSPTFSFKLAAGVVLADAKTSIDLWNRMLALPDGDQMRCHTPRYGIHLGLGGENYTAAICWECNNISISNSGDYDWRTFDGQSEDAQSLLGDIKAYVTSPTVDTDS